MKKLLILLLLAGMLAGCGLVTPMPSVTMPPSQPTQPTPESMKTIYVQTEVCNTVNGNTTKTVYTLKNGIPTAAQSYSGGKLVQTNGIMTDAYGRMVRVSNANSPETDYMVYSYYDDGSLKEVKTVQNGEMLLRNYYEYDAQGHTVLTVTQTSGLSLFHRYVYNEQGLLERVESGEDDLVVSILVYTHDAQGRILTGQYFNARMEETGQMVTCSYVGNVTTETTTDGGTITQETVTSRDEWGHILSRTVTMRGETVLETTYVYTPVEIPESTPRKS